MLILHFRLDLLMTTSTIFVSQLYIIMRKFEETKWWTREQREWHVSKNKSGRNKCQLGLGHIEPGFSGTRTSRTQNSRTRLVSPILFCHLKRSAVFMTLFALSRCQNILRECEVELATEVEKN